MKDAFMPILFLSLSGHLAVLGAGQFMPTSPQMAVLQAPNTLEMVFVEEPPVPEIEEVIEYEKVVAIEETIEPSPEVYQPPVEEKVEKPVEEVEPIVVESHESKGAEVEAKPLDYINPAPAYPRVARRRGWEGVVILRVFVTKDGMASRVEIEKNSGYKILDEAALSTVQNWKFSPAQSGDLTFSSQITVPVEFRLVE